MKTNNSNFQTAIGVWVGVEYIGLLIATAIWGWTPSNACIKGLVGISNACPNDIANHVLFLSTIVATLAAGVVKFIHK